ncbi:MAG: DMT family transporter [Rhodospirillaceae bacterium]|nr:MAG: DMT family transporter [Rhodospirillaceae bacterium]
MTRIPQAERRGEAIFIATLIASTFLMGSSFVAGKILLHEGFSPMMLVGWRFFVAALATLPLVYFDNRKIFEALAPKALSFRDASAIIVIGLTQTAAVMGLLFLAMTSISASTAAILLFTNPIWVALLGRLFLGEALHKARILGLLLGVIGVALTIGLGPDMLAGGPALRGELIGLLSALCWSAATIFNKRAKLPMGTWALSFWQMLVGAVAILGIAYARGETWPASVTVAQWGWFLWLAIPASTGSFGLWFVALAKGGATKASGYLFLAPLFTVVMSFPILGSSFSWLQAAGGLLIGFALWLINRRSHARKADFDEALAKGRP